MSVTKKIETGKNTCQLTFQLSPEQVHGASKVQVLGDFNNWNPATAPVMKKGKNALTTEVIVETGLSYEFRYLLDGQNWVNIADADRYVAGPFGEENGVLDIPVASAHIAATATPEKTKQTGAVTAKKAPAAAKMQSVADVPAKKKSAAKK